MDIRIPHLADGVESGTVVNVFVSEGQVVKKDENLLDLETDKAVASIPSPASGRVTRVMVRKDDKVAVGQVIVSLAEAESNGHAQPAPSRPTTEGEAPAVEQRQATAAQQPLSAAPRSDVRPHEPAPLTAPSRPSGLPPAASPTIRRLALELGIDLNRVHGTERGGRIVMDDLRAYIGALQSAAQAAAPTGTSAAPSAPAKRAAESIDFSKWGPVEKKPLSRLRKTIAERMSTSWTTIPHVTQFDEADITALLALKKKYDAAFQNAGAKLTVTSFAVAAAVAALKKFPGFNASLDEAANEIVLKRYYHLGIAVDSEEGLIVPVVKDADRKSLLAVSTDIAQLAEKTRQRKIGLDDLQGGTFTITNLGGIGGTHFTPIVNHPQVAILGIGRSAERPVYAGGKLQPRVILPVALSYDHRVVDGADGARFLREVVKSLEAFDEAALRDAVKAAESKAKPAAPKREKAGAKRGK